ncbi:TPA: lytic transglycosylase domain-containing protein [Citrobacter freundii]
MLSTAALAGLAMTCAASVHPDTVMDVARTESSFNPLAIGVVGGKPIYPDSIEDAIKHLNRLKAAGKNFSVGLMQINQANFSRYSVTSSQLLDPCKNLSVFEKIISDCYQRGGTVPRALSCYYSGNFITGQKPEKDFSQTTYVQRIGYNPTGDKYSVPSTRDDIEEEKRNQPAQQSPAAPPVYESWDVLREYPRPAPPPASPPQNEQQKENKAPADVPETRAG